MGWAPLREGATLFSDEVCLVDAKDQLPPHGKKRGTRQTDPKGSSNRVRSRLTEEKSAGDAGQPAAEAAASSHAPGEGQGNGAKRNGNGNGHGKQAGAGAKGRVLSSRGGRPGDP